MDEQLNNVGDKKMDEDLFDSINPIVIPRKKDLYIKRDYIRTLQVICRWKNFLFVVIMLCLLLLQISFLLVNYGYAVPEKNESIKAPSIFLSTGKQLTDLTEGNLDKEPKTRKHSGSEIKFEHIILAMNVTNTILIFSSVLYGLIMFCGLGASLGGELGGTAHISRACIYSLIILILLLPWQLVFKQTILGAVFTPWELTVWRVTNVHDLFSKVLLYLRFTGYPIFVFILLILTQLRSFLWNKAVIHRLDQ
jgi:hypothetical protein